MKIIPGSGWMQKKWESNSHFLSIFCKHFLAVHFLFGLDLRPVLKTRCWAFYKSMFVYFGWWTVLKRAWQQAENLVLRPAWPQVAYWVLKQVLQQVVCPAWYLAGLKTDHRLKVGSWVW
jgi:hypothetical protein